MGVTDLTGADFLGENYVWAFENPQEGDTDTETWTFSACDQACATWESASDNLSDKFTTLEREGATYREKVIGGLHCIPEANAKRRIKLDVKEAAHIDRVWTATRFTGTIRINWECNGQVVDAVLDFDGRWSQSLPE